MLITIEGESVGFPYDKLHYTERKIVSEDLRREIKSPKLLAGGCLILCSKRGLETSRYRLVVLKSEIERVYEYIRTGPFVVIDVKLDEIQKS